MSSDFTSALAQLPTGVQSPMQLDAASNLKVTTAGSATVVTPIIVTSQQGAATVAGQAFSALFALNAGAAGIFPLSIWNASTLKNILIYSLKISSGTGGATCYLRIDTSNPNFATTITPNNRKAGGPASVATCSATSTSQATPSSLLEQYNSGNMVHTFDFFNNGQEYLLPAGSNNGLTGFIQTFAAGLSSIVFSWIEY